MHQSTTNAFKKYFKHFIAINSVKLSDYKFEQR